MRTATLQCLAAFLVHYRCSINIFGNDSFYSLSQFAYNSKTTNCNAAELLRKTRFVDLRDNRNSQSLSEWTWASRRVQTMALGYLLFLFSLASPHGHFGSKQIQHLPIHLCQGIFIVATYFPQATASFITECQICWSPRQALGIKT